MTIDRIAFSPLEALVGGALIGVAAALLLLVNGRIAGISGIVGGLLQRPRNGDIGWRLAFVAGLVAAPLVYRLLAPLPPTGTLAGTPVLILAGLLVGFGSRLGSGCTSGHGVCGLSRLSPRSLVATACFMTCGFATVFVVRHVLG